MNIFKYRSRTVAIAISLCAFAAMAADKENWLTLARVGTTQPESLSVARDLPDQAARDKLPVLLEVKWSYKALPNGMPTEEELVVGKRLDDGLDGIFGAHGVHVMTRTGDGNRTTYYYIENPDRHADAIKSFFESLPAISVEVRARDEPDWETVREVRGAIK